MTTPADSERVPVQFLARRDLKRAMEAAASLHDMSLTAWLTHVIWESLPVAIGAALELERFEEIRREHQERLDR